MTPTSEPVDQVIVWGNCQAGPVADLLRGPLAAHGLHIRPTPPVYLITAAELADLYRDLDRCAVLVSQPVTDTYPLAGCGTAQLASRLPSTSRLLTFPVVYDLAPFPFMCHGHDLAGRRHNAPITDYHDLRAVRAADLGYDVQRALAWWPQPDARAVRAVRETTRAALSRRESRLDVAVSHLLDEPGSMWTMTHPTNGLLASVARFLLQALDVDGPVDVPSTEYLAERCAPVEPNVVATLGWPTAQVRADWTVRGDVIGKEQLLRTQLDFYREHPDVVAGTLARESQRVGLLDPP